MKKQQPTSIPTIPSSQRPSIDIQNFGSTDPKKTVQASTK